MRCSHGHAYSHAYGSNLKPKQSAHVSSLLEPVLICMLDACGALRRGVSNLEYSLSGWTVLDTPIGSRPTDTTTI